MSTELGRRAEEIAADWLASHGFEIIDRNWRNRFSEIDIVASKDKALHFVEVKYRKSALFGDGFEYITADKQRRLKWAAAAWMHEKSAEKPFQIDAVSISGEIDSAKVEYLANIVEEN